MMQAAFRSIFFRASTAKPSEFVVHKNKYIIPRQPVRASSPYILYSNEMRSEFKDLPVTEQSKAISEKWKSMSEEDKKTFQEKATQSSQSAKKQLEAYRQKYIEPLKTPSLYNFIFKQMSAGQDLKNKPISEVGKICREKIKGLSDKEKKSLEKKYKLFLEAQEKNAEKLHKFMIPEFKYTTLRGFISKKLSQKGLTKSKARKSDLEKFYKQFENGLQNYEIALDKFVNSLGLSMSNFKRLLNKQDKSEESEEQKEENKATGEEGKEKKPRQATNFGKKNLEAYEKGKADLKVALKLLDAHRNPSAKGAKRVKKVSSKADSTKVVESTEKSEKVEEKASEAQSAQ